MNEREIFLAALQFGDTQERCSYRDSICQPDDPARKRINKLLKAHYRPQDSIEKIAEYIAGQTFETDEIFSIGENEEYPDRSSHELLRKALGELFKTPELKLARPGERAAVATGMGRNISFRKNAVLVTFDGPARAVRAGIAINETAIRRGVSLQTGLHTGECDFINYQVVGTAVEMAELTARRCSPGETVVTNTVKDLVVGSGLVFSAQGTIDTPGISGQQTLHRVVR